MHEPQESGDPTGRIGAHGCGGRGPPGRIGDAAGAGGPAGRTEEPGPGGNHPSRIDGTRWKRRTARRGATTARPPTQGDGTATRVLTVAPSVR
jgi:hypothetical protein